MSLRIRVGMRLGRLGRLGYILLRWLLGLLLDLLGLPR